MTTRIVDTNVWLGRWPTRRLPLDEPAALVARLKALGVVEAWAGSFDGLLHRDLASANHALVKICAEVGDKLLVPFGTVNPKLPDWQEDLRCCHEEHNMPGIRLHPNYHGYSLSDDVARAVLTSAAERELIVVLVVSMEDERTQHPLLRAKAVDCGPLPALLKSVPGVKLLVLNALRSVALDQAATIASARNVWFDIAVLEGAGGLERAVKQAGLQHLVFGSHAPLFYPESAVLKLRESELAAFQIAALSAGNALRLRD